VAVRCCAADYEQAQILAFGFGMSSTLWSELLFIIFTSNSFASVVFQLIEVMIAIAWEVEVKGGGRSLVI
jgi:hypothetical protein